jgi:peptidoglycan/LPS O-acetylase OafA/YrhL
MTLVLGFWLVLSFVAGALLFLLIDLPRAYSLKRELSRKSQDLARTQFELNRAQAAAAPPPPLVPPPADLGKRLEL